MQKVSRAWFVFVLCVTIACIYAANAGAQTQVTSDSAFSAKSQVFADNLELSITHREGMEETQRTFFIGMNTTQALTIRASETSGVPTAGLAITPIVASEPDGVTRHMTVTPAHAVTDAAGQVKLSISPGNQPGRYQVLLFRQTQGGNGSSFRRLDIVAQDTNWATFLVLSLAGGLAIFLYGMKIASDGLQGLAGKRLRTALAELTRNQLLGLVFGIVITFFTQSSGATTVMLMSFVRARLLSFRSSLGIILGAAIGGTITVQLISFNLFAYALPAVAIGFSIYFVSKRPKVQSFGLVAMGFGLVFFGMKIMTDQMAPLKFFPFFRESVEALGSHPVWAVIFSAAFTALSQSSGATLGIVLALARQDLISLHDAIPIFFGASIGVCFTGFTGSLGAPVEAKRIAMAHFIYKVAGVIVFLPFIGFLEALGESFTGVLGASSLIHGEFVARSIANTYTLYIMLTALMALPFVPVLEKLSCRFIQDKPDFASAEPRTKYLDEHVLDTPSAALGSARREISRMGRFVEEMMKQILSSMLEKDLRPIDFIKQRDNKVDHLNTEITHYLTHLTKIVSNQVDADRAMDLLYIVSDIESIGDIIDKNLVPLAQKLVANELDFSEDGKRDLMALHHKVSEHLSKMLIAISTGDTQLALPVLDEFQSVQEEGKRLHTRHLQRLQNGLPESIETSSIHLDVINYFLRIHYLVFDISLHITGKTVQPQVMDIVRQKPSDQGTATA